VLRLDVPGLRHFELRYLVLDVNGTLALDGKLLPGIAERLNGLRSTFEIHLLTADTHGGLAAISAELGLPGTRLRAGGEAEQKAAFVRTLAVDSVVAIGNGANDVGMLREAALGVAVLGPEGLAVRLLEHADVLAGSPTEALDLLLQPKRLIATLRR